MAGIDPKQLHNIIANQRESMGPAPSDVGMIYEQTDLLSPVSKRRALSFLAVSLCLSGCAPYPVTYYKPEFENGYSYSTSTCDLGPNNGVGINDEWGGMSINVQKQQYRESADFAMDMPSSFQVGSRYLKIHIGMRPAEGVMLVIRQPGLSLSIDSSEHRMFKFNSFYKSTGRLRGTRPNQYWESSYADLSFDEHSGYVLDEDGGIGSIWIDADSADSISIDGFEFEANGEPIVMRPITFRKSVGVKVFTINC